MNKDKKIFPCYSIPLNNFLKENGLSYEIVAQNPNTGKLFFVYMYDEKLATLLDAWNRQGKILKVK